MSMIKLILLLAAAANISTIMVLSADSSGSAGVYELRVYYAPAGKLDQLHARFRNHTMKLFEKHGIRNVAYFVPATENPENKLVYFLYYPNREARDRSWKSFMSDPDWQKAWKESEK